MRGALQVRFVQKVPLLGSGNRAPGNTTGSRGLVLSLTLEQIIHVRVGHIVRGRLRYPRSVSDRPQARNYVCFKPLSCLLPQYERPWY
ncbi:hypothetical protein NDU88_005911 [Pleurodeles waltl]|uniref:Uncharacterized protein n=1 Tax=Pleurodeles waltl TaxID=8319 RepID=A0AAV7TVA9_PLEWA|nr:hypothetical protein NDU88_005911 [Pleurodeles waltl]